ncbi:MAG: coproporphyrinogen-III oxidase family protein [Bacteriovoracaceae bacterium]
MLQTDYSSRYSLSHLMEVFPSPGKRYTLSPTPSKWRQRDILIQNWFDHLNDQAPWDLYIHIPFCKSICTFCGCNVKITEGHDQEGIYIDKIIQEWSFYKKEFPQAKVNNLFIGGGTPNALSDKNLARLLENFEFEGLSIELAPQLFTESQAKILSQFKVRRVSFGVQDLDQHVLQNVNRQQKTEDVYNALFLARKYGLGDISIDLIYGMPLQTSHTIEKTFTKILSQYPDLVYYYPLAHVPWQASRQKAYGHFESTAQKQKNILYEKGVNKLNQEGYKNLGFNAFVLKDSSLDYSHSLKRNICSIGSDLSSTLIGLGVSSITSNNKMYLQNHKIIEKYLHSDQKERKLFPIGYIKSEYDISLESIFQKVFEDKVIKDQNYNFTNMTRYGLLEKNKGFYKVTEAGLHFLPHILDQLEKQLHSNNRYS